VLKGAVEGAADPGGALNPDVGDLEAAPEGALADDVDGQYWMGGGGGGGDGKVSGDGPRELLEGSGCLLVMDWTRLEQAQGIA